MRMRSYPAVGAALAVLAVALLLTSSLSVVVGSGDPPDRRVLAPVTEPVHPVAMEIQSLKDAQEARLRDLAALARAAEDPDEERALQREIQRVKLDTEVALYEAQLRHAESRGDLRTAETLREVLAAYANLAGRRSGETLDRSETPRPGEGVAP